MLKYLLIVVLIVLIFYGPVMSALRRPTSRPSSGQAGGRAATPARIVACAHCGVHLPESECLRDDKARMFCSEAHRIAGPRLP